MPPSSPSSPAKTSTLSYAERVKKTQNIRSPNSLRPLAAASNPSTTATSIPSTSAPPDSNTHSPTGFGTASSFAVQNCPEATLPSSLPDHPNAKAVNGDPHRGRDLTSAALSIVAAHSNLQKPPPTVNVWSVRKMAQAQSHGKTTASQMSPQNVPQPSPTKNPPQTSVRPSANDMDLPPAPQRASDSRQNGNHRANTRVSVNGVTEGMANVIDDPFIVRVYPQPPRGPPLPTLQPPSIDDTESWPEVGKAPSNETTSHQGTPVIESPREKTGQSEDTKESVVGLTPRKNDKTKWVPIPAEELQAAADALQVSNRRSHSRNHSQHSQSAHKQGGNSHNNPPSGSGSAQGHSRTHSGRNSMSQSQVQSRAGSVQSSPRHSTRGRGLPHDAPTGGSGNGAAAIEVVNRSSPQPQSESGPGGLLGQPNAAGPQQGTTSYPNIHAAVQSQSPQDQRQRLGHSPLQSAFSLPGSGDYTSFNSAPPPIVQPPQPGYASSGITPYPLYPPYGNYESTQPLLIYGSGQHSPSYRPPLPLYPPQPADPLQPFARPPPPDESEAVTGHKGAGVPPDQRNLEGAAEVQEKRMRAVVFGSIGLPGSSKGPSPTPRVVDEGDNTADSEDGKAEKTFTFSIGVAPGEPGPSRARSTKIRRQTAPAKALSDVPNHGTCTATEEAKEEKEDAPKVDGKVIDLTETKWAFGTIKSPPTHHDELGGDEPPPAESYSSPKAPHMPLVEQPPHGPPAPLPPVPPHPLVQTSGLGMQPMSHLTSPINGLPMAAPFPMQRTVIPLLTSDAVAGTGSEWEVKDYGYGFGHGGYVPPMTREERVVRDRERERERSERERADLERERVEREGQRDRDFTVRPRRGSYGGFGQYERAGFGGRRGRGGGVNGGFGGGRGFNTRGGRGGYQPQPPRQPPFTITPPPQFQPLSPISDPSAAYYLPRQNLATYIPTGYESYQPPPPVPTTHANAPPVPVPLSTLSFPLDPIRTYLLGQLEYYLSPQNMAQDFFLRQRMDSRGWIPISLIASFNRVRMLTSDPQIVREVLVLSTMVEVQEDWVRMLGWEQFVLPDAARSTAEGLTYAHVEVTNHSSNHSSTGGNIAVQVPDADGEAEDCEAEAEAEEDEEEEVEFVLERVSQSWSPEQRRQV